MERDIYGQRVLPDGTVSNPSADKPVPQDPGSYPPSQDQYRPAIAYSPDDGRALVVWQDAGHYDPDIDTGIWGRFWVPTERMLLPLILRAWPSSPSARKGL